MNKTTFKYNYDFFTSRLLRFNSKSYNTIKLFSFFTFETRCGEHYEVEKICELLNLKEEEYNEAFRGLLRFKEETNRY